MQALITQVTASLSFLKFAFLSSLVMAMACGFVGSFLILKRQSFLSDTIAHASILGIALGFLLGVTPEVTLLPFTVIMALGLTWLSATAQEDTVAITAVIFSFCSGLGILILEGIGVGSQEMIHVFLGDLLWLNFHDLLLISFTSLVVVMFLWIAHHRLTLVIFNRELALAAGIRSRSYETAFTICIALLIAVSIKLVGVFLVTSLVTVPPLIAGRLAWSFRSQINLSVLAALVCTLFGFFLALIADLPLGPGISAFLGGSYLVFALFRIGQAS